MNTTQERQIRILMRCNFGRYGSRDASVVHRMAKLLDVPEGGVELDGYEALKLPILMHKYRRLHGQCACTECLPPLSAQEEMLL